MDLINDVVHSFLAQSDWHETVKESGDIFVLKYTGENGVWSCIIHANEDKRQLMFYSLAPMHTPLERLAPMAEFILRLNFGLIIGSFEFDLDDGEIRYKTSIDVSRSELNIGMLSSLVANNLVMMDKCLPAIWAVIRGLEPKDALKLAGAV